MRCNSSFSHSQMRSITAPNGDIIGYEIRPLYDPLTYGVDDVLYTDYRLAGDKVVIRIWMNSSISDMFQDGSDRGRHR